MSRQRLSWIVVVLVALLCTIAVRAQTGRADSDTFPDVDDHFRYGSIGTEEGVGIPYWIWQVLPRLFADKLPPGGYSALGMIWEPGHDTPIGFSKKTIWGVSRVAINCAFCHTQSVRTSPGAPPMVVLAGASQQLARRA